ncbi:sensor histidine kinase NtrY-like [Acidocella aminolytica]|uniref:histidine kinase n=1 Tax=Acidocella aminolytica 101 = DSM 11237 TaxID=1120923 RepID=A0A0D6PJ63_9PROT|nr:PAS domain-containing sensor histidine kinase [Acidocella aminolytica]GAN81253.1 two component sensor histidine kinase NtrY [Acidocella aminolytica 101 = DSM 11237]GBQ41141.1 two component sensor histidine kinase NtrY [Acidocella aminolytica 101 = DSM 11237]SHE84270.1 two-component system, NtrC family, nitrogen regulation sensor histidine kinase NtrY [Acidocella aminolytica 101 = DSM 11237]
MSGQLPQSEKPPARSRLAWAVDLMLGRVATLLVASVALVLGIVTFALLAGRVHLSLHSGTAVGLIVADFAALLLLILVLAGRVTRVVLEHRRGAAGARLHVRLVLLFGGVAAVPAILVAVFAIVFFNFGVQAWFNNRVQTALAESDQVAQGYLSEHENDIRLDALAMANDLSQAGSVFFGNPNEFASYLVSQTSTRGLTQAVIFDPLSGQVIASAGLFAGIAASIPNHNAIAQANSGQVPVISPPGSTVEQAVIKLDITPPLMLMVEKPIDPAILDHVSKTKQAVAEYQRLARNRSQLEISFAMIIAVLTLLVLSALIGFGLVIANQIAKPLGHLIRAAETVRDGDLDVQVPERNTGDEMAGLSRAFNRMTAQLAAQHKALLDMNDQLDERRRFTETVLAGVSAGVIGLDTKGRIELPNRAASELLRLDLLPQTGQPLAEVVPEFAPLIAAVMAAPERAATAQIEHGAGASKRVLLVRIGAEMNENVADGFIVTFDDVTELMSAQRKAAWADVARRIAHEIKNPLTPIQLSAERLKRRFAKEITSDPESFTQCAETIVRHVGDIGRMVDEFSTFARMPQPVMRPQSLERLAREAMVLQRVANRDIEWNVVIDKPLRASCDRRLIGQALTNLLQNAADAVTMRQGARHVTLRLHQKGSMAVLSVTDDGIGLPETGRDRLTEPYVTHKPKGTGLGLAIVAKIMEDHGGRLELKTAPGGTGAEVSLILPALPEDAMVEEAKELPAR